MVAFSFDDGQTRLHTATEQLWMQPTLAQLLRRLDPQQFFQVSRAVVVRLDAVREAKPNSDGTGQVVLSNGTPSRCRAAAGGRCSISSSARACAVGASARGGSEEPLYATRPVIAPER